MYLSLISSLEKKKGIINAVICERKEISILTSAEKKDVIKYMSICHSWY